MSVPCDLKESQPSLSPLSVEEFSGSPHATDGVPASLKVPEVSGLTHHASPKKLKPPKKPIHFAKGPFTLQKGPRSLNQRSRHTDPVSMGKYDYERLSSGLVPVFRLTGPVYMD